MNYAAAIQSILRLSEHLLSKTRRRFSDRKDRQFHDLLNTICGNAKNCKSHR